MDRWIHDETVFISSSDGSSNGVVHVYELLSADIPLGEDSFSFIGEATDPSTLAPLLWRRKDYIRLLNFIRTNSLMVNGRGHVILKSATKSHIVGGPDGPTTYWRCLDLLPMQIYGLVSPTDEGIKPNFLITGEDVDRVGESTTDVAGVGEWEVKYKKLDAAFNSLKSELEDVKGKLALADNSLTISQAELDESKLANKQLEKIMKAAIEEIDRLKNILNTTKSERQKAIVENNQLQIRIGESEVKYKNLDAAFNSLKSEFDDLKVKLASADNSLTLCQAENKELTTKLEESKSANEQLEKNLKAAEAEIQKGISENKQLQNRTEEIEVESKKATEEINQLKEEVSNLQSQLDSSVAKSDMVDELKKQKDDLVKSVVARTIIYSTGLPTLVSSHYVAMKNLKQLSAKKRLLIGRRKVSGVDWDVYVDGTAISAITVAPYKDDHAYTAFFLGK